MLTWSPIRHSKVRAILKGLKDIATGPDHISAMILRTCFHELSHPITRLCRVLYDRSLWPNCWKLHWLISLHKRGSQSDGNNYRAVHLTTVLSKIVEHAIGDPVMNFLEKSNVWGSAQFAYRKDHSCQDALAFICCTWIMALRRTISY